MNVSTKRICLVGALALFASFAPAVHAQRAPHTVIGEGVVDAFGGLFKVTVAAHQDASGRAWGVVVTQIFRAGGEPLRPPIILVCKVNCMHVVGNVALIGAAVIHSNGPFVGELNLVGVRDLGGEGKDIMHGEFASSFEALLKVPVNCGNIAFWPPFVRSFLTELTVVKSGNFWVL